MALPAKKKGKKKKSKDTGDAPELALPTKRRKRKKKKSDDAGDAADEGGEGGDGEKKLFVGVSGQEYGYHSLLGRAFNTMRKLNPEMDSDSSKTLQLEQPVLVRVGTKKTGFQNMLSICQSVNRDPEHVLAFMLAELGTTGTRRY